MSAPTSCAPQRRTGTQVCPRVERYTPVFIGGVARSGTTLLSALLSTSASCNPFAPEFHCLGALGTSLSSLSLPNQELLYTQQSRIIEGHVALIRTILDEAWSALGRPSMLVVKHCSLTALFPLLANHLANALFVVIIRDPRAIIASLLRSQARGRTRAPFEGPHDTFVDVWIRRFNTAYGAVISASRRELANRVLAIEHESLCRGETHHLTDFFGLRDINPDMIWRRAVFDIETYERDPMYSQGWGKPMGVQHRQPFEALPAALGERVLQGTRVARLAFADLVRYTQERSPRGAEIPQRRRHALSP